MTLLFLIVFFLIFFFILNIFELKKTVEDVRLVLVFIALCPILTSAMTVIVAIYPFFWIFKRIIGIILKIRIGSDFVGLVEGLDVTRICDKNPGTTSLLILFKYNPADGLGEWYQLVKNAVKDFIDTDALKIPQLFSEIESCVGYYYMKRISVTEEDCVKKLRAVENKTCIDRNELIDLISEVYYDTFPIGGKALWDIFVGTQPVLWDTNKKCFPVIVRSSAGVFNGTSLSTVWNSLFPDLNKLKTEQKKKACHCVSRSTSIWSRFYTVLIFPSALFTTLILKGRDKNVFSGKPAINREVLGVSTDADGTVFAKLKKIKIDMSEATYAEVMLTAYTASLNECIEKNPTTPVKEITALMPFYDTHGFVPENEEHDHDKSMVLKLPIGIKDQKNYNDVTPLMSRLHTVKQTHKNIKDSVETDVFTFVTKYFCAVLPKAVVGVLLSKFHATAGVNVLEPLNKISFYNGKVIGEDCCLWLGHTNGLYTQFAVTFYNDKLQVAVNSDEVYFKDHKNAQTVADGVCKYIDLLGKEVNYMYD